MIRYFWGSGLFTVVALAAGAALGWSTTGTVAGALQTLFICAVLGVLEVSLSFDNAVVNATVLQDMTPLWRRRFLTWGVVVAVFGMRIVFPLLIVVIAAKLAPWDALRLALEQPERYEQIVTGARVGVAGFGGAFLGMVGLKFFFDVEKDVHWIAVVERQLGRLSRVEAIEISLVLLALIGVAQFLPLADAFTLMVAGVFGVLTFIGVEALGSILGGGENHATGAIVRTGLAAFLYLELLDASFSFDGVIGAFALSNNLIVIALGLGIGAMFVRSLTVFLVDRGSLAQFKFLEHGAFWAILALSGIMLASARWHVPEVVTGLIGAVLIGAAFLASILHNRRSPEVVSITHDPAEPGPTVPAKTREEARR